MNAAHKEKKRRKILKEERLEKRKQAIQEATRLTVQPSVSLNCLLLERN